MRIREMNNYYTVLLIVLLLLISKTDATAEPIKTMKWKEVGYAKNIQLADAPDFKGHIVGMFERRGLDIFEDGTVAVYKQMGSMDGWDTGATCQGYTELSFEDGSTIIYKFQGSEETKPGELPRLKGDGTFIKGTGRFSGIKGTLKFTGRYYTSLDDDNKGAAIFEVVSTYTLP